MFLTLSTESNARKFVVQDIMTSVISLQVLAAYFIGLREVFRQFPIILITDVIVFLLYGVFIEPRTF
jgi:hypothetical protein